MITLPSRRSLVRMAVLSIDIFQQFSQIEVKAVVDTGAQRHIRPEFSSIVFK